MARTVDTCFVAMTRPSVKWGVPLEGFIANGLGTFVFTVAIVQAPPGFLAGIGVHFAIRELCRVDPHFFWRWRQWGITKGRSLPRTVRLWGGSHLQPSATVKGAATMPSSI
jgi:type IV secretory pathway VirB3-like protein